MFILPDLQLSSTTCWISPPKKGTLTSSSCSKLRAEAKPVTRGTYFRELVGPAQFLMTNVRKFTQRKSLKGWGLVRRTHFRYRCLSMDRQGISGTLTPIGKKKQKGLWQDDQDDVENSLHSGSNLKLTDKMEGLDFSCSWNSEFVLWGNRKGPISVPELPKNVNLRHVVPYRLHQLQMWCLHTL